MVHFNCSTIVSRSKTTNEKLASFFSGCHLYYKSKKHYRKMLIATVSPAFIECFQVLKTVRKKKSRHVWGNDVNEEDETILCRTEY